MEEDSSGLDSTEPAPVHIGIVTPSKTHLQRATTDLHLVKPQSEPNVSHKSPAHVRFVNCGLGSDVYLRHALSSPYNKTSSHQMDIGSPILFKTPSREQSVTPSSSGHSQTPRGTLLHPGVASHVTPQSRMMCNPFDSSHERIHFPGFSPGLFTVTSTPVGESGGFKWSIEHIAALNPANIEELPSQMDQGLDHEAEEQVQQAIVRYFSSQLIVPSPWHAPESRQYLSPCTPISQSDAKRTPDELEKKWHNIQAKAKTEISVKKKSHTGTGMNRPTQIFPEDLQGSIQKELSKLRKSQDATCQTTLSLPVDFDVENALGDYLVPEPTEETNQEVLSTSSLRRKLFFHGETSANYSPMKSETGPLEEVGSPPISPLRQTTPEWDKQAFRSASGHFSSSPIKGSPEDIRLPQRTSTDSDLLASPELSPISKKRHNTIFRSSGCGAALEESFTFDPEVIASAAKDRLSHFAVSDLSPIVVRSKKDDDSNARFSPVPMRDMSPIVADPRELRAGEQRLLPVPMSNVSLISFGSPASRETRKRTSPQSEVNLSPVSQGSRGRQDKQPRMSPFEADGMSPIKCSMSEDDTGSSFIQERSSDQAKDESTTPQAEHRRNDSRFVYIQNQLMTFRESTAMEIETSGLDGFYFKANGRTCTFPMDQNFSGDDMDSTSDYAPIPSSTNQDTGYQTGSLQLTGLHTNLTSHFNSLPFKTENSLDCNDLEENVSSRGLKTSVDLNVQCASYQQNDSGLADEQLLLRARQALALASSQCPAKSCDINCSIDQSTALPPEPIGSSTPSRRTVKKIHRKVAVIKKPPDSCLLASEMAEKLLKEAGDDLARLSATDADLSPS